MQSEEDPRLPGLRVTQDHVIIDGHQRYGAALQCGYKYIAGSMVLHEELLSALTWVYISAGICGIIRQSSVSNTKN